MKNLVRCFVCCLFMSNVYAQDWIPFQGYQQQLIQTTTINQPYIHNPQPTIIYQYVPYVVNQTIVTEKRCIFHNVQKVTYVPTIQYIYQPVVVYR